MTRMNLGKLALGILICATQTAIVQAQPSGTLSASGNPSSTNGTLMTGPNSLSVNFTTPNNFGTFSAPVTIGTGNISNIYTQTNSNSFNWLGNISIPNEGSLPWMGQYATNISAVNHPTPTLTPTLSPTDTRFPKGTLRTLIEATPGASSVDNTTGTPTLRIPLTYTMRSAWLEAGFNQSFPILPNSANTSALSFTFNNVKSDRWFDPVIVPEYRYEMLNGSLFTRIADFPTGFNSPFTVKTGGITIGAFLPGQSVDFQAILGGGVTSFSISGINPGADATNELGFPLRIAFNTPTADFKMTGIPAATAAPEPCTLVFVGMGIIGFTTRLRRKKLGVTPLA
jgi:hypothetical protein